MMNTFKYPTQFSHSNFLTNGTFPGRAACLHKLGLLSLVLMLFSCKKFVEVSPPINQVNAASVFATDQSGTSAVTGLYSQMMAASLYFMNGALTVYPALSADELLRTEPDPGMDQFTNNSIQTNSPIINNDFWRYAYQHIYQANACLEGLNNATSLTPSIKQQLTGEAKFLRALYYFYLTNVFGDIPLQLSTDYTKNQKTARASQADIYQQIISDLMDAQNLLQPEYPTGEPVRANRWAATALLARVYLYQGKWQEALLLASAVINADAYQLETDLNRVFLADNTEAVLQFVPVLPSMNSAEGANFIPSSDDIIPLYALTNSLLNAFEAGDGRRLAWVGQSTINSQDYFYPFKYKIKSSSDITEYNTVLRLAELFLIRAEANAQLNNVSEAVDDLNALRTRAGLDPLPNSLSQPDCLNAVYQERRVELFAEWGHRWFDLKRTGQADAVLGTTKPAWKPSAVLYPIPFGEIQLNPLLTQNAGY